MFRTDAAGDCLPPLAGRRRVRAQQPRFPARSTNPPRSISQVGYQDHRLAQFLTILAGQILSIGGNITVAVANTASSWSTAIFRAPLHYKIKAAISGIFEPAIKYLINTHYHGDHTCGFPRRSTRPQSRSSAHAASRFVLSCVGHRCGNCSPPAGVTRSALVRRQRLPRARQRQRDRSPRCSVWHAPAREIPRQRSLAGCVDRCGQLLQRQSTGWSPRGYTLRRSDKHLLRAFRFGRVRGTA